MCSKHLSNVIKALASQEPLTIWAQIPVNWYLGEGHVDSRLRIDIDVSNNLKEKQGKLAGAEIQDKIIGSLGGSFIFRPETVENGYGLCSIAYKSPPLSRSALFVCEIGKRIIIWLVLRYKIIGSLGGISYCSKTFPSGQKQ